MNAATADSADMTQPSLAVLVSLQDMHVCQSWLSGRPSLWTHTTNSDRDVLLRSEFEGYSDDETVRVVMTGNQEPKSVDITDSAYEQGSDVSQQQHSRLFSVAVPYLRCGLNKSSVLQKLAALVTEAMRDAHTKSVEVGYAVLQLPRLSSQACQRPWSTIACE